MFFIRIRHRIMGKVKFEDIRLRNDHSIRRRFSAITFSRALYLLQIYVQIDHILIIVTVLPSEGPAKETYIQMHISASFVR